MVFQMEHPEYGDQRAWLDVLSPSLSLSPSFSLSPPPTHTHKYSLSHAQRAPPATHPNLNIPSTATSARGWTCAPLPCREAGPLNHHDDMIDSDQ